MLAPTKHTNIRYSVIFIAGIILKKLKEDGLLKYDELKNSVVHDVGEKAKYNMEFALTFLFSIGKIRYDKNIDAIELIDPTNED